MKIKTSEIKDLLRTGKLEVVVNPTKQYIEAENSLAEETPDLQKPEHKVDKSLKGMQFIYKKQKTKRTRNPKVKWIVYGEVNCGNGTYTNVNNAKWYAKQASKQNESKKASVWLIEDNCCYIEYENGKLVRDGWTKKRVK